MKRLLWPAAILATVGMFWKSVTPAEACSPEPGYDAIDDSDVIVGGRFIGWQGVSATPDEFNRIHVRLTMTVDQVFKGEVPATIEILDTRSVESYAGEYMWSGSSGFCGTFDFDPTGMYSIIGLYEADNGTYSAWIFSLFFLDPEPHGERYEQWVARLRSYGASFPWLPAASAAVLGPVAFLLGSAFVWRQGGLHNG